MLIRFEAMPLDDDIVSRRGESQACFEIVPSSVSQMFEIASK